MSLLPILIWLTSQLPQATYAQSASSEKPTPTPTPSVWREDISCQPFAMRNCTAADLEAMQASRANVQPQAAAAGGAEAVAASSAPVINVWYGSNQPFGQLGNPQQWINVLGNITPTIGVTLSYSLNNGPASPLSIGPDRQRLASPGDFNVEISITQTLPGPNQVVITARDSLSHTSVATVTAQYASGNAWPEPYAIDWAHVTQIQDVAQIVDGLWTLQPNGIRPAVAAYDRVIAIGDMTTWDDYEVTVPITIHATNVVTDPLSGAPGIGIVTRWRGHTDDPIVCPQPHCGWLPSGANGWYDWGTNGGTLYIGGDNTVLAQDTSGRKLSLNTPYYWKMRVETQGNGLPFYSFKVWAASQIEPPGWDLAAAGEPTHPATGSLLLVAHHVDATFGNVIIAPGPFTDTTPPVISNIQVAPQPTSATLTWMTNEWATSQVDYGLSPAYENGSVSNNTLAYQHVITLTGLISDTVYHYQITSVDPYGNSMNTSSSDLTFKTPGVYGLTINVLGNGTVTRNPDQSNYLEGQVVTLTATATAGWTFTGWSGDLTESTNPVQVTMTGNKTVMATFGVMPVFLPFISLGQLAASLTGP